jgi:L-asparaginase/N4-(beta-N-acetylglucosaminyl)-L-asparaginase
VPDRRRFLKLSALASTSLSALVSACTSSPAPEERRPVVISTWNHGEAANAAAWDVLSAGGAALDAVEQGVRVTEADPSVRTVGLGGWPDASGTVTLDACIMNGDGRAGSVAYLRRILHPVSVARRVMEATPHVMLVGDGALRFARAEGFSETTLLTPETAAAWEQRQAARDSVAGDTSATPEINIENHDTIGMLALDRDGTLAGACTTSGTRGKMPGRVGDSPLIGAGLYVEDGVGAACATGWGEAVIRTVGSHAVVEQMRQGAAPDEACRRVAERLTTQFADASIQVGFLALSPRGEIGAYSVRSGFTAAVYTPDGGNRRTDAPHVR